VDTGGATLMPGLTDCHVHLCLGAEGDPGTAADKLLPGQMTLKALEHGCHVICEKPMAFDASMAASMVSTSPSEQGPIGNTGARLRLGKRTVNPEVAGSSPVEPANQAFPRWWPPIFPLLGGRSMSAVG